MWVLMMHTAAGPRLPHPLVAEKVYELPDELAEELIGVRAAKEVPSPNAPQKKAEAAVETAAVEDGETETAPGAEKKAESLIDRLKPKAAAKK